MAVYKATRHCLTLHFACISQRFPSDPQAFFLKTKKYHPATRMIVD
jgi:hypothetical protein